jgi:hypothetical protein
LQVAKWEVNLFAVSGGGTISNWGRVGAIVG